MASATGGGGREYCTFTHGGADCVQLQTIDDDGPLGTYTLSTSFSASVTYTTVAYLPAATGASSGTSSSMSMSSGAASTTTSMPTSTSTAATSGGAPRAGAAGLGLAVWLAVVVGSVLFV
jgi:hypothetical protein